MARCVKCGTELEGGYCPECGYCHESGEKKANIWSLINKLIALLVIVTIALYFVILRH
jgi:hypothetical protein